MKNAFLSRLTDCSLSLLFYLGRLSDKVTDKPCSA